MRVSTRFFFPWDKYPSVSDRELDNTGLIHQQSIFSMVFSPLCFTKHLVAVANCKVAKEPNIVAEMFPYALMVM